MQEFQRRCYSSLSKVNTRWGLDSVLYRKRSGQVRRLPFTTWDQNKFPLRFILSSRSKKRYKPWWSSQMPDWMLPRTCSVLKADQLWSHNFCFYCVTRAALELWQTVLTLCLIPLSDALFSSSSSSSPRALSSLLVIKTLTNFFYVIIRS